MEGPPVCHLSSQLQNISHHHKAEWHEFLDLPIMLSSQLGIVHRKLYTIWRQGNLHNVYQNELSPDYKSFINLTRMPCVGMNNMDLERYSLLPNIQVE